MKSDRMISLFRWIIFAGVTVACVFAIIDYWTLSAWPIIVFNSFFPPFLFWFLGKHTANRLGIFMVSAPVIFILEMMYLIYARLPIPLDVVTNELAFIFTISLTVFALFGEHFDGWLKKHMDALLYPLLGLNLIAYLLIYYKQHFNLIPYLLMLAFLAFYYLISARTIRSNERMIIEQHHTNVNTRIMMRGQIHDISNFLVAITSWFQMAGKERVEENRREYIENGNASSLRLNDHLRTILDMLTDQKNMVHLCLTTPQEFVEYFADFLKDSFVGEIQVVAGDAPRDFVPATLVFAHPISFTGKHILIDIKVFCTAILNLISNARKAGANAMIFCLEERRQPHGLQLRVQDNGSGIPAEKKDLLFKQKVQSDSGSGIGLIGVRMVINCHGATIALTNNNSDGKSRTEFTIAGLEYVA